MLIADTGHVVIFILGFVLCLTFIAMTVVGISSSTFPPV